MITFHEADHKYTNEKQESYISVTQLIKRFTPEFQSEYWSTYKAVKDVITKNFGEHGWSLYKRGAGGWEQVVDYYNKYSHSCKDEIDERSQHYLDLWEKEKEDSCIKGSKVHKELEDLINGSQRIEIDGVQYSVSMEGCDVLRVQNFVDNKVYAELLIYNNEYKVAGTVDRVVKFGKILDITDYKTCKKIDREGFRGEALLYPLTKLQNCEYDKYTMQLSLYAWMLEQRGYEIRHLTIAHLYGENNEKLTEIPVPYRKKEVELMLKEYKHQGEF